tara:strand:+ start:49735 stop:50196 length:462 start_codon:yes stop_codon:yes gene_type:complete
MNIKKCLSCLICLIFFSNMEMSAQNERSPEEALYELYEENIEQWKGSENVKNLIASHPELLEIINKIDAKKLDQSGNYKLMGFIEILTDEALLDSQVDMLVDGLSPENISFIEDFYWKIINSPKSKKVADLLVDHLLDAKDKLEIQVQELSKN